MGAFFATLGVILPSFFIILIVAKFFQKFSNNKIIKGIMSGLKPAVIGLIASAVLSVAGRVLFPDGLTDSVFYDLKFYISLLIFFISAFLVFRKVHPIFVIILAALFGILFGFWLKL